MYLETGVKSVVSASCVVPITHGYHYPGQVTTKATIISSYLVMYLETGVKSVVSASCVVPITHGYHYPGQVTTKATIISSYLVMYLETGVKSVVSASCVVPITHGYHYPGQVTTKATIISSYLVMYLETGVKSVVSASCVVPITHGYHYPGQVTTKAAIISSYLVMYLETGSHKYDGRRWTVETWQGTVVSRFLHHDTAGYGELSSQSSHIPCLSVYRPPSTFIVSSYLGLIELDNRSPPRHGWLRRVVQSVQSYSVPVCLQTSLDIYCLLISDSLIDNRFHHDTAGYGELSSRPTTDLHHDTAGYGELSSQSSHIPCLSVYRPPSTFIVSSYLGLIELDNRSPPRHGWLRRVVQQQISTTTRLATASCPTTDLHHDTAGYSELSSQSSHIPCLSVYRPPSTFIVSSYLELIELDNRSHHDTLATASCRPTTDLHHDTAGYGELSSQSSHIPCLSVYRPPSTFIVSSYLGLIELDNRSPPRHGWLQRVVQPPSTFIVSSYLGLIELDNRSPPRHGWLGRVVQPPSTFIVSSYLGLIELDNRSPPRHGWLRRVVQPPSTFIVSSYLELIELDNRSPPRHGWLRRVVQQQISTTTRLARASCPTTDLHHGTAGYGELSSQSSHIPCLSVYRPPSTFIVSSYLGLIELDNRSPPRYGWLQRVVQIIEMFHSLRQLIYQFHTNLGRQVFKYRRSMSYIPKVIPSSSLVLVDDTVLDQLAFELTVQDNVENVEIREILNGCQAL
ncbi:hypothetical protein J6590_042761 [Homalodisca vitripennis]|nr:hypothetical protein J6590_042761 [Homalodisca vitripennis]